MANQKKNSAAEAVAELTKIYNDHLAFQNSLPEDASVEEIEAAKVTVETSKKALDEAVVELEKKSTSKEGTQKVKFLLSPVGQFNLAYNVGEIGSLPKLQAAELVEAKYAEFVK